MISKKKYIYTIDNDCFWWDLSVGEGEREGGRTTQCSAWRGRLGHHRGRNGERKEWTSPVPDAASLSKPLPSPHDVAFVSDSSSASGVLLRVNQATDVHDDSRLQLYKSMIGSDGWCTNYDKSTRTCNIYQDRPFFCRVEPKVFDEFFGVPRSRFNREACSACVDNIKMVYGEDSTELSNFKCDLIYLHAGI